MFLEAEGTGTWQHLKTILVLVSWGGVKRWRGQREEIWWGQRAEYI